MLQIQIKGGLPRHWLKGPRWPPHLQPLLLAFSTPLSEVSAQSIPPSFHSLTEKLYRGPCHLQNKYQLLRCASTTLTIWS